MHVCEKKVFLHMYEGKKGFVREKRWHREKNVDPALISSDPSFSATSFIKISYNLRCLEHANGVEYLGPNTVLHVLGKSITKYIGTIPFLYDLLL